MDAEIRDPNVAKNPLSADRGFWRLEYKEKQNNDDGDDYPPVDSVFLVTFWEARMEIANQREFVARHILSYLSFLVPIYSK